MKKQKRCFFYSTIIVLFTVLLYACKADIQNAVASITGSPDNDVAAAQEWYNKTFQASLPIGIARVKSSNAKFSAKPDWKHAYSVKYEGYSAVHTPLNTQQRFSFVTPDNKQAYETTGDARYISTFTQMVVINEKKDDRMYAFLMTLVPDKAYLESTHFAAFSSNYRKWQKGYSGYVFYHTLDGHFNNGWKFENGKVTMRVTQVDENGIDISMGMRNKVSAATICSTLTFQLWSQLCYYTYTNSESQGAQNVSPSTCSWSYEGNQYLTVCYDDGGSSGGGQSTGGGYTGGSGSSSTPTIQTRTNCPSSATDNSIRTNGILNYTNTNYATGSYADVNSFMTQLRAYAGSSSYEWGGSISFNDGMYYLSNQAGGGPYIYSDNNAHSVRISTSANTSVVVHTHPNNTTQSPSPEDVMMLCRTYSSGCSNIYASVVFASNGSEYVIYIDNQSLFNNFCSYSNFPASTADHLFPSGTTLAIQYNAVYNNLINLGYSADDANSYAISYVLDNNGTGLKISEKKKGQADFKEQQTIQSGSNYQPQKCQ
ncbi:hypothetical protein [Paludibacter sp.]|uniref:hypothetical protein n=1 Tax=Paludibacter sp. TaxID=1898105 RepID=UPI00135360BA|nr:hypothetical protein [Paludibacter sp.]MTK52892.1 hypothetical protein [Paludibacter sp.]